MINLVLFTAPNGKKVWVVPTWVTKVRPPLSVDPPDANCVIVHSGGEQAVREFPEDVVRRLGHED
jgi:hypothetical protein